MALILGIDRFLSEARMLVSMIGNGVATVIMAARSEKELTGEDLQRIRLAGTTVPGPVTLAQFGERALTFLWQPAT
jgi:hypothetical protein